jgi:hypothetical protein
MSPERPQTIKHRLLVTLPIQHHMAVLQVIPTPNAVKQLLQFQGDQ